MKQYIDHIDDKTVKVVYAMLEAAEVVDGEDLPENEEKMWRDLSAQSFLKGYGADEPEYTEADIKEPNSEYKGWKGK